MRVKNKSATFFSLLCLGACAESVPPLVPLTQGTEVHLMHGEDVSAGDVTAYIVTTPSAVYYLDKEGGGLSSMIDADGIDWVGFHSEKGTRWKGEYRGFPNAVHRQDGSFFHAKNSATDPSTSVVNIETANHIRITFTSENDQWQGQWDFFADRCDFTMTKVSPGHKYWVLFEGVPGGSMDQSDYWYASSDHLRHPVIQPFVGDLKAPEWIAFGDQNSSRMLFMFHHQDDDYPDDYVGRPHMTVFGFGRRDIEEYLTTPQTFSIGFVESTEYSSIEQAVRRIIN